MGLTLSRPDTRFNTSSNLCPLARSLAVARVIYHMHACQTESINKEKSEEEEE